MTETIITNTFASFQKYSAKEGVIALLSLLDKLEKFDWLDLEKEMAWKGLLEFRDLGWTPETVDNFDLIQNKIISLLNPEDFRSLEVALGNWDNLVENQYNESGKRKKIGESEVVSEEVLMSGLKKIGIKEDLVSRWVSQYSNLLEENKNIWFSALEDLDQKIETIKNRLSLVFSFFRYDNFIKIYTVAEVKKVLNGEGIKVDEYRLARTFGEYLLVDDGIDMVWPIYDNLGDPDIFEKKEYTWEDSFFMTIYLHFIFNFWSHVDSLRQKFILSHYCFRAILAGVSVQEKIKQDLYYENSTLADYVNSDFLLYKSLENSVEEIDLGENNVITLGQLFKIFLGRFKDKFLDSYGRENFIDELLQKSNDKGSMKKSLREVFYIFVHLKTADLVDMNATEEPSEKEYFENQLEHLLVLLLDSDYWDVLIDFYSKEDVEGKRVVKLGRLLDEVRQSDDLNKNNDLLEKIIKFNDLLKSKGFLSEDEDVIYFDEKQNKFEWNEKILKNL